MITKTLYSLRTYFYIWDHIISMNWKMQSYIMLTHIRAQTDLRSKYLLGVGKER